VSVIVDINKKVLIVEPDIKYARELFVILADEDYDIILSRSFDDAAKKLKAGKLDCIIMDVNLPDMKGYEAVPIIKKIDPKIQIIMVADQNTRELEAEVRKQDIFYYYIKSFEPCELKLAVCGIFEKLGKME
jgi:DNA-binding NtrC family response regulator